MNAYKAKELKSRSRGNCNNCNWITVTYLYVAIESDRSTEFKVLCSAEQVKKMKERNQIESEKLKRKREKAEEEKRKYKDKVGSHIEIRFYPKFQKFESNVAQLWPKPFRVAQTTLPM